MTVPTSTPFYTNADTTLISAPGVGNYIHVVGISFFNNDSTAGNDVIVRLKDGSAGSNLYGDTNGAIYIPARGGNWDVQMSYDYSYWDLSENTELYMSLSATRYVSGCVWSFIDTTARYTPKHATFDLVSNTEVISAVSGQTIKIVALAIHNNDADNDEVVHLTDGNGGTDLYGTSSGGFYLPNCGGTFNLPMNYTYPWFELSTNTALYINVASGYRVSGCVWYYQD